MKLIQRWWFIALVIALVGAALTWVAFGLAVQEKPPPDLTNGVELIDPRDRGGKPTSPP